VVGNKLVVIARGVEPQYANPRNQKASVKGSLALV